MSPSHQLPAQHVKQHQCLAVAYRLGACTVAATEVAEWKVILAADMVGVFLQGIAPVLDAAASLFLDQVIGKVTGEALGPVATIVVDKYAIAPPVVQDLVRIG